MEDQRAQEAEVDGQGPDGSHHPRPATGRRQSLTPRSFRGLTHLSPEGAARMVDVSDKRETVREAVARALVRMRPATLRLVRRGDAPKGDVLGAARLAGIMAAKRTPQLIPLCHPLRITGVDVSFRDDVRRGELAIEARVRTVDKTGVEMEALTAAAVAALTVYDMVKAVEKGVTIARIQLVEKSGGKSGRWTRRRARA
ncbi:MAG: cyclic pyranopterin monophosphate synthase MoaC [Candidatus Rokubacteria bacterium]|nr:cyclic pyranopterin monophosphate synthase MoaC [Candidatus Rokubacteria bacterium]MBI2492298.1 cyclic pyranopterin monophosphate synthase MoaC [Candidatus Rokubacteria bacterium]